MIEVEAKNLSRYYRASKEYLVFFYVEHDSICSKMEENITTMETKMIQLQGLKVKWWEFQSIYEVPCYVKVYTLFYMNDSQSVGTIYKPNLDQLEQFCKMCHSILNPSSETLFNKSKTKNLTWQFSSIENEQNTGTLSGNTNKYHISQNKDDFLQVIISANGDGIYQFQKLSSKKRSKCIIIII